MRISRETKEHIKKHLQYPATKQEILEQCGRMADVDVMEKIQVERLPEKKYKNAKEVLELLAATN